MPSLILLSITRSYRVDSFLPGVVKRLTTDDGSVPADGLCEVDESFVDAGYVIEGHNRRADPAVLTGRSWSNVGRL
jgi:hypothetical protein